MSGPAQVSLVGLARPQNKMVLWGVPSGTWPWSSRPQQGFLCPAEKQKAWKLCSSQGGTSIEGASSVLHSVRDCSTFEQPK